MWVTTLNKLKEAQACKDRYRVLLQGLNKTKADDEPLTIETILDINGVADALWSLRCVEGTDEELSWFDREMRLFAVECARRVLPLFEQVFPDDNRPRQALDVAERYAMGLADETELFAARADTRDELFAVRQALDVAERYAMDLADETELFAARADTRDELFAVRVDAIAASAACAAWAAYAAAASDASASAYSASWAAWAARDAEHTWQVDRFRTMVTANREGTATLRQGQNP